MRMDGWRGWCKSRRKALVKLNSHEPRVSLNSIPEMEVIIITSGSGWRLRQLWLMSWSLFDVLLFLRDAPAESNDVSTTPNQTADADTCNLAASPGPKQPRRRNSANCVQAAHKNQTSLEAETAWVHVCFGRPRVPNDLGLDADTCSLECWAETATTPKQRKLRPCDKKNEPASKPKRLGFPVCLGHVFVSVSRAPQAT